MSDAAAADVAEDEHVDESYVPHEKNVVAEVEDNVNGTIEETDDIISGNPQSIANTPQTGLKIHVSAHEQDREEQASRRVQEAQRYHGRDRAAKTYSRGGWRGYKNNSRFDPTKQEKSDDPAAIRKQVEFYFSDSNLLTDKFLFERVEGHKNVPISIDVIHSFKRMQRFQPREAVIEALKESSVLEVVDDDNAIQRKEPLPENLTGKSMDEVQKVHEDRSMAKSIYAKGFGEEESTTQFDIEAWFANYGPTNSVRLRRDINKGFKGSVFVEFDTEEKQQKFLSLDPPAKWRGKDLEIKSKKQYCDAKVDDINMGRIRRNSPNPRYEDRRDKRSRRGSPTYDDKRHDYVDGDDDRDWRQRRNEEAADRHRGSKHKSHGNSGRRGRGHHHSGRDGRDRNGDRSDNDSGKNDPTHAKVTSPELSANGNAKLEVHHDEEGGSKDTAKSPVRGSLVDDAGGKKRAHEEDGHVESQRTAKRVDLKGDSD